MKLNIKFNRTLCLAFLLAFLCFLSCSKRDDDEQIRIAVSNSYLESAIREFLGADEKILRLAEPGMCPGHFDLQPSHIIKLSKCRLLIKFDFQKLIDERIFKDSMDKHVISVKINGGLCCPENYLNTCRQISKALIETGIIHSELTQEKIHKIEERMRVLSQQCHKIIEESGLKGVPILTSIHQADFCSWLGFEVAGKFSAADIASFQEIERAIDTGKLRNIKVVVANKPEGRRLADALADRLGARVVVFENFPQKLDPDSFDHLVLNNVRRLIETCR